MWDPSTGLGTVTHQTLGYLFPMGPYYWLMQTLGFPDWVAQRLWLGTHPVRRRRGRAVPDAHDGLARPANRARAWDGRRRRGLHALALRPRLRRAHLGDPAAVGGAALAHRHGDAGRPRGRMAVAGAGSQSSIAIVGGVNATALLFAGIGPVLWFVYAMWVSREIAVRRRTRRGRPHRRADARRLVVVDRRPRGRRATTASRSSATPRPTRRWRRSRTRPSCCAGSGYWFFYGDDKLGPWIEPSVAYTQHLWLHRCRLPPARSAACSPPALCGGSSAGYFVALLAIGTIIAVGSHPFDDPTPYGSIFSRFAHLDLGLALRSTPRAVPLIVLVARGDARRRDACRSPRGARPWVSWPR